jgi:diamine N-acetyltransferase
MVDVSFVFGDESLLDRVKPLWEELNRHHLKLSPNFKQYYQAMTFEKRKIDLLKKAACGEIRVDLAVDSASKVVVGYCVTSLNLEKTGEIESIFVYEAYRGLGIGGTFMKNALQWLYEKGAAAKIVEVGAGNEQAFGFYEKYSFFPRKTMLKQVTS